MHCLCFDLGAGANTGDTIKTCPNTQLSKASKFTPRSSFSLSFLVSKTHRLACVETCPGRICRVPPEDLQGYKPLMYHLSSLLTHSTSCNDPQTMLDPQGQGAITYLSFLQVAGECLEAELKGHSRGDPQMKSALEQLSAVMKSKQVSCTELLRQYICDDWLPLQSQKTIFESTQPIMQQVLTIRSLLSVAACRISHNVCFKP